MATATSSPPSTEIELRIPGLTATGLRLTEELPFEIWERLGATLGAIREASVWAIGDWINYGEAVYGERYAQAVESTGLQPGTLMDYRSVAAHVPYSRRRGELTFSHHRAVRSLDPEEQKRWLGEAVESGWTVAAMREAMGSLGAGGAPQTSDQTEVSLGVGDSLRSAAEAVWNQAQRDGDRYVVPSEPIARLGAALGKE